jgi:hypothetical protein
VGKIYTSLQADVEKEEHIHIVVQSAKNSFSLLNKRILKIHDDRT